MKLFGWLHGSADESHGPSQSRPAGHRIVVGLDFGTSSVKVALRDLLDSKSAVALVDFGTTIPGYSRFAFPSTIRIAGGLVEIGEEAESNAQSGGTVLRSGKMHLLRRTAPREFHLSRPSSTSADPIEFAVTLLLAGVLRRVREIVDAQWTGRKELLVNLDVPVDSIESSDLTRRFQLILDTAVLLSAELSFPCSENTALDAWWATRRGAIQMADVPPEQRLNSVIGEAQAILTGIRDMVAPHQYRPYAIVDIGAGTTDVGVFRFTIIDGEHRMNFFSAGSALTGCDDLDAEIAMLLGIPLGDHPTLLGPLRGARTNILAGSQAVLRAVNGEFQLTNSIVQRASSSIGKKVAEQLVAMWREAYAKHKNTDQWAALSVIVVGGGALVPDLRAALRRVPDPLRRFVPRYNMIDIDGSMPSQVLGGDSDVSLNDLIFLTAARGLTYTEFERARLVTPIEIEPVHAERVHATGLYDVDADDLYQK